MIADGVNASSQPLKIVSHGDPRPSYPHSHGPDLDLQCSTGVSTVEQAHVFLGVDEKTSDDFIITMFTAKVNNLSSNDGTPARCSLFAD